MKLLTCSDCTYAEYFRNRNQPYEEWTCSNPNASGLKIVYHHYRCSDFKYKEPV